MHPSREKLRLFVENKLNEKAAESVRSHLDGEACEFCREFCRDYRLLVDSLRAAENQDIPVAALAKADQLYRQAMRGQTIPLVILTAADTDAKYLLAADGSKERSARVQNLTTLYSEDPEIVLRVMRDPDIGRDYLQLISEDAGLVSHVLVQIPEMGKEYLTDESGHASLGDEQLEEFQKYKWQVKMPDAVFDLEPLVYDPDKTEYSGETILETENRDRIQVTFEGKTEGKQVTLRILELDGSAEFGTIRVSVSQRESSRLVEAKPNESVTFDVADPDSAIVIRLYQ